MTLVCNLEGVRGGDSGFPVQLVRDDDTGRLNVRAINEGGFACCDIDLADLVKWLLSASPDKTGEYNSGNELSNRERVILSRFTRSLDSP